MSYFFKRLMVSLQEGVAKMWESIIINYYNKEDSLKKNRITNKIKEQHNTV